MPTVNGKSATAGTGTRMGRPPRVGGPALLLDAGLQLAAEGGALTAVTVESVVERAGTGRSLFYRAFGTRESFLLALHTQLTLRLWQGADERLRSRPGSHRLRGLVTLYLDNCQDNMALKAFLSGPADQLPALREARQEALRRFAEMLAQDLRAMAVPRPDDCAQLIVALAHEIAVREMANAAPKPGLREGLAYLIEALSARAGGYELSASETTTSD